MFRTSKPIKIERYWQTFDNRHDLVMSMLRALGVEVKSEFFHGEFYGTRYIIEKPYGKGSVALTEKVYKVFEDYKLLQDIELTFEKLREEMVWSVAWSKIGVINEAAVFFDGCKNVLDIGSGVGKFVLLAAQIAKKIEFTGVEIDQNYYNISVEAKERLKVPNANFIKDDFKNIDLKQYDGIYIFNPFCMSRNLQEEKESIAFYESIISQLKKGTRLVMNNKDYRVPLTYKHIKNSIRTDYYIKQS